jgi:hypothetical protein
MIKHMGDMPVQEDGLLTWILPPSRAVDMSLRTNTMRIRPQVIRPIRVAPIQSTCLSSSVEVTKIFINPKTKHLKVKPDNKQRASPGRAAMLSKLDWLYVHVFIVHL